MEFIFQEWPLWLINLGLSATLFSTLLTIVIYFRTRSLSTKYNNKASSDYIVSSISSIFKLFTQEIQKCKEDDFKSDDSIKYTFWRLIHECKGCVSAYKKKNDKDIYVHINEFKINTKEIEKSLKTKEAIDYEVTWSYYMHLTTLNEAIKSEHDMRTRKV